MRDQNSNIAGDITLRFFLALTCLWLAILVAMPFTKVSLAFGDFHLAIMLNVCIAIVGYLLGRFGLKTLRDFAVLITGLQLIALPMLTANYMSMSFNMPLADEALMRWDAAIGFDWIAFIKFIDARPWLAGALGEAYGSFLPQLAIAPALLLLFGYSRRAHAFMISFGTLTLFAAVIAIWFPAYGTYTVYGVPNGSLQNINSHFGYQFIDHFEAVRSSSSYQVSAGTMSGILTFPSVHAGVAYLLIWATWPLKWFRYPFLVLNIAMAIAAVSHANHYLVDILASIPLAIVTVVFIRWAFAMNKKTQDVPAVSGELSGTEELATPSVAT